MSNQDDLEINAYVDHELSASERAELLRAMQDDAELSRRACEAGNLKNQVQLAYADPPGLDRVAPPEQRRPLGALIAAALVLIVAGLGGWLLIPPGEPERFVMLDPQGRGQAPATADSGETRIVFHLVNPDQVAAGELLDDVEQMLTSYRSEGRTLRVEIVSHGDGLTLLRQRLSQHRERIHRMATSYHNLTFVACLNTKQRAEVGEGIEVRFVPDAQVIDSGVEHVARRQRDGWIYIRV